MSMYRLSLIFLLIVALFSFAMLILLFYPMKVIEPNIQPYKIATPKVRIGEPLIYIVDACKYMDVEAVVGRSFVDVVDGTQYPALSETNHIKPSCSATPVSIVVPPILLPNRKYRLQLDINYRVNALRDVPYHFNTDEFEILPQKEENRR